MHKHCVVAVVAAAVLAMASQSFAQTNITQPAPKPKTEDLGSVYLRCDGMPPHRSGGEIAARLVLIMATAGLAGPGETADVSKRLTGADAVTACNQALEDESDPIRKAQLVLARAVHHIEIQEFEAALADARAVPTLAGPSADELGFRHSLLVSGLELEAAALVRLGRPAEAEATALKMAAASPYDIITQERASRYTLLTAELSPEKREFLDRRARLWPVGLLVEAIANQGAGQYLEAAADYAAFLDIKKGFMKPDDKPGRR